jgi:Flp pilus assembly pilin Flp
MGIALALSKAAFSKTYNFIVLGGDTLDFLTKTFVRAREWHKGQTMTEYALILSAVAVVVYLGYQTMGTAISGLLSTTDGQL